MTTDEDYNINYSNVQTFWVSKKKKKNYQVCASLTELSNYYKWLTLINYSLSAPWHVIYKHINIYKDGIYKKPIIEFDDWFI